MAVVSKTYELKVSTKDAQANVDELNKSFEAQEDLVSDLEKELAGYNKKLSETEGMSGKAMSRRDALNKKIRETKNRLVEEKQGLKDVNKDRKRANDTLKESKKSAADYNGVLGLLDQQTGGLISSTRNFTGSLGAATKGSKLLKVAMLAIPLVAVATAIVGIATAFTSSEEGQNKFSKFFTKIKVVIGNVTDILADFGMAIIKVFKGDFKGARESIDAVTEGIKNFAEETKKEIGLAGELADKRADADKLERQLLIDRAEATRKFNELREKAADKENVSIEDRIAALKEAGRIEEEITLKEIEAATLRADAKTLENSLSKSTKEDLDEEAALRAKVIELEASRLKKQKTLTAEITTNLREAESERKAIEAQRKADIKEEERLEKEGVKKLADFKNQVREATAVSEDARRALELTKIEEHYQKLLDNELLNDEQKSLLEDALREKKKEKQAMFDAEDDAREKAIADKKKAQDDKEIAEAQKIEDKKRAMKLQSLDIITQIFGAESALGKAALVAKQLMAAQELLIELGVVKQKATMMMVDGQMKAVKSGTDTASGLNATLALGFPAAIPGLIAYAGTAVGIVAGIMSAIRKQKTVAASLGGTPKGSESAPASIPTIAPEVESTPPEVTGVGGSGVSQIAEALGSQAPVQAFVVSNDVTTAQGLERNIIDGASL